MCYTTTCFAVDGAIVLPRRLLEIIRVGECSEGAEVTAALETIDARVANFVLAQISPHVFLRTANTTTTLTWSVNWL